MTTEKFRRIMLTIENGNYGLVAGEVERMDTDEIVAFCQAVTEWECSHTARMILGNLLHHLGGQEIKTY